MRQRVWARRDLTSATAMFLASASLLGLVACGGAERVRHVEAAQASAGEIVDGDGLRLDLGKTPRCVILPRRLQVPADCGGMDLGSAADRAEASVKSLGVANASVVALVMWRLPGGEDAIMTVMSLPHSQFPPAAENVGDGLAGFYNSVHAPENKVRMRDDPRLAHDRITVAATPAVRYASDTQQGGRLLAYLLFGGKRTYVFQFLTPSPDDSDTRALAQALMARMAVPPLAPAGKSAGAGDPAMRVVAPFRAGQRARVEVHLSGQVQQGDRARQRWDMRSSYILALDADGDDLVVERRERTRWEGDLAPPSLAATYLAHAVSRFVLTEDHLGVARIDDVAGVRDRVFEFLRTRGVPGGGAGVWNEASTEAAIRMKVSDSWDLLARGAMSARVFPGQILRGRGTKPELVFGTRLDVVETVRNLGDSTCPDGRACVRLEILTEPDTSQLRDALERLASAPPTN